MQARNAPSAAPGFPSIGAARSAECLCEPAPVRRTPHPVAGRHRRASKLVSQYLMFTAISRCNPAG